MAIKIDAKTNRKVGLAISYLTIVLQILISFWFTPFVLRVIGDREYGLYSFAVSITTWLSTFVIAIATGFSKYLSKEKKEKGPVGEQRTIGVFFKIFVILSALILLSGFVLLILFYTGAIPLTEYSEDEKNKILLIMVFSFITISITTLLSCFKSYFYYKEAFVFVYSFDLLAVLSQTGFAVLLVYQGVGVLGVAIAHYGSSLFISFIQSLVAIFCLKEKMKLKSDNEDEKEANKKLTKEILVFSSFVIINTLVDTLNQNLGKTVLGFANADSVTLFQIGSNLSSYMVSLSAAVGVIFNQKITDAFYSSGGQRSADEVFRKVSRYQLFTTFLIVGGFASCGFEFVKAWVGNSRIVVFYIAFILMVIYSAPASCTLAVVDRRLQNLHKKASLIYLLTLILNLLTSIILCLLLSKEMAIWACVIGAAVSIVFGQVVVMSIYDSKQTHLSMKRFYIDYISIFGLTVLCVCLVFLLFRLINISSLNLWIQVLVKGVSFCFLYLPLLFFCYRKTIIEALSLRKK